MRIYQQALTVTVTAIGLFVAACASPAAVAPTSTAAPVAVAANPTASPTAASALVAATAVATATANAPSAATSTMASASPTSAPATSAASTAAGTIVYNVVASGTKADYRVREQLAKLSAPSDAVGTTTGVTGGIVIGSDGKIVSNQSKLVVDLTKLQSDSGMRDGFIGRTTLNLAQYPTATFVPTAIDGLTAPLPTSGQQTFTLTGNLTIHGVTKPATLSVTTQVNGGDVIGQASTNFKFEDFGMTPPTSMAVLSVVDDVKLEITLHLTKSA